ncbi:MAG: HD domain-containing protein [Candidatus Woesearchaeota archaeon]
MNLVDNIQKKFSVAELKDGMIVDDIFFVKFKKGISPYQKGYAFELMLSDSSGKNIEYRYWGGPDESQVRALYDSILPDSVVRVQGRVSTYKEKLQLVTNEPMTISVLKPGQYDPSIFIKHSQKDIEGMKRRLFELISYVKNEEIKRLLRGIFEDEDFMKRFSEHPGAIEIHHNWIGGLLEHTLEVAEICLKLRDLYPELDLDLLIAGSLLHDIGKLEEIEVTSRIRGTVKGQLYGHITLGTILLEKKCREFNVSEAAQLKLIHIIISHHGKNDYGSPKEPMFPEAAAVYYADEISSKISEMINFVRDAKEDTEDEFMFHKRSQKNIFLR